MGIISKSLQTLDLYHSDDVDRLTIWAPHLSELNLRDCHGLDHVRLLKTVPFAYMETNKMCVDYAHIGEENDIPVEQQESVRVNVIHANIDEMSKYHLQGHPRVRLDENEDDDSLGSY